MSEPVCNSPLRGSWTDEWMSDLSGWKKMCHILCDTVGLREQSLVVEEDLRSQMTLQGWFYLWPHHGLGVPHVRSGWTWPHPPLIALTWTLIPGLLSLQVDGLARPVFAELPRWTAELFSWWCDWVSHLPWYTHADFPPRSLHKGPGLLCHLHVPVWQSGSTLQSDF